MRDKIIGFIISVVCFIISFGFVKGQAMALPFVPTDWTWEMYQGLHMLGDLIANDVNFDIPDWVDFNDFDDVKAFLEMIYNEGKKKVAYASIIADMCVGTWQNFLDTGEVSLPFSESTIKRTHNTGFFQQVADTINSVIPEPDPNYLSLLNNITEWEIIHIPNWSVIVPDVWIAPTQNDYTHGYFIWDTSIRKAHTYYRANDNPDQWSYIVTNQDVYSLDSVITININKNSNDKFDVILPSLTWSNDVFIKSDVYPGTKYYGWRMKYNGAKLVANGWYSYNPPSVSNPSSFNTLYDALYWIVSKFKNFNLYVNGNPWALVGGAVIDNPLGVEIPQNVIDEVENGKISGFVIDATLPDTDNLVGSIDLGTVIDELREAQANGRTATLDGVRTKDGVRAIDGTVVGTVSKAVAIDVPSTASLVTAADEWGYIPYYPEIPSAFSGTTILSELIDATQTIVPNELIMAIWGLVIILFIIALINIFHK